MSIKPIYLTPEQWKERYKIDQYQPNKEITDDYDQNLAAKCSNGTFVGKISEGIKVWKGVPFAKTLTPESRFMQSQLPDDSDKVYEAYHFGKSCMQPISPSELASSYEQGEDCLTLAVFTANNNLKNKPVLVYIHGGGWINGGTADPLYDGRRFAYYNPDMIVVTITYRVGLLGQINLSHFKDYKEGTYLTSCNNGILDQVTALRWIKKNISAFGGDSKNITICGESAGGCSVSSLCLLAVEPRHKYIKENEQLFKRAIAMSGGMNQFIKVEDSHRIVDILKLPKAQGGLGIETIEQLKNASIKELQAWWNDFKNQKFVNFCVLDGEVFPKNIYEVWAKNMDNKIDVMQGATTNEYAYYSIVFEEMPKGTWEGTVKAVNLMLNGKAHETWPFKPCSEYLNEINKYYVALEKLGYTDQFAKECELANDYSLQGVNYYQAYLHTKNGGKEFIYAFDQSYDGQYAYLKAAHAADCGYLFGNFNDFLYKGTKQEVDFSIKFQAMIAAFCKNGNPSINGFAWKPYDNKTWSCAKLNDKECILIDNYQLERYQHYFKMLDLQPEIRYISAWTNIFATVEKYFSK